MSRIASILEQEYKTKGLVGGTASAVGKAAKEKLDFRNALFGGSGVGSVIGTKIFGKGYSATRKTGGKTTSPISDNLSSGESPVLQEMNANMKLTAKNSMSLPMMARDMNLMKLNIFKLVKAFGDKPNTNKTDMFWEKSKIRDAAYNNTIGKMMGNGNLGKMSKSLFLGRKERDGQTPESALYVTGSGTAGEEEEGSIVKSILSAMILKRMLTATLGLLSGPVGLTLLAGFGISLAKKLRDEEIASNSEKYKDVPSEKVKRGEAISNKEAGDINRRKALGGLGTKETANEIVKRLIEDKLTGSAAENFVKDVAQGSSLQQVLDTCDSKLKEEYLKMVASLQPTLPDTGAGAGRGLVNPTMPTGAGAGRGGQGGATAEELIKKDLSPSQLSWVGKADVTDPHIMSRMPSAKPGETTESVFTGPMKPTTPSPTSASSTSPTPSKNPLLEMISKGESASSGGYNAMNQGTPGGGPVIGSGDSQKIINKKLTDMTVGEVMDKAAKPNDDAKKRKENGLIFAAGRYQIIPKTLEGLVKSGVVSKEDKFDEATQDKLGMALIQGTGALKLAAAGDYEGAQNALAKTWASIPLATDVGNKKAGQSFFHKVGTNTAHGNLDVRGALMSGSAIASASTSIADSKMALVSGGKGNTIINNNSPTTLASSSSGGSKSTPYQQEFYSGLVTSIAL